MLGRRKVNEDRYSIAQISDDLLYFAIFDGHSGATAVEFVQAFMQHHISYWLQRTAHLSDVLRNSFIDVNNLLTRHLSSYNEGKILLFMMCFEHRLVIMILFRLPKHHSSKLSA